MQQQIIDHQFMTRKGRQVPRKLNKDGNPLSVNSKNSSMKMNSKKFPVSRRSDNATTNISPKAVSRPTMGRMGAGKSIGKKTYSASRVVEVKPAQQSKTGASPLKKTVSTQPREMMSKKMTMTKKAPSYTKVKQSLRRTMGYS